MCEYAIFPVLVPKPSDKVVTGAISGVIHGDPVLETAAVGQSIRPTRGWLGRVHSAIGQYRRSASSVMTAHHGWVCCSSMTM